MQGQTLYAISILNEDAGSGVSGVVRFVQTVGGKTTVYASVNGLSSGQHGFHIHEFGNLSEGCKTAGAHYNPNGQDHGGPDSTVRHVGDMGNITSDGTKASTLLYEDSQIQLSGGQSVIGRAVVVHADPDDLGTGQFPDSKTTGHAGARVACGVIGLSNAFEIPKL